MGGAIVFRAGEILGTRIRGWRAAPLAAALAALLVVTAPALAAGPAAPAATAAQPIATPNATAPGAPPSPVLSAPPATYQPGGNYAWHEPFVQDGPIGSQTPDGYDALGPEVTQPIEFPHYIHVEQMGIDCLYCHTYARRSAVSGIPRLNKCIGCHQSIPEVRDKPRIQLLFDYWDKQQAIPWKKVHDLPDFVRFNHERHIQRFIFQQGRPTREVCGYCHGDVGKMTTARRVKAISMGWCISCHEQDHKLAAVTNETAKGPNDCWQCHK
ncbi:MAG: cytochrome c3 family protein [Steroidobacteraceae bacterium]|jgi:hypothetical protein